MSSSSLMPVADATSKSLINSGGKSPSPTFPSFLPLEIFDDTEYDCRTPQEWVSLSKNLAFNFFFKCGENVIVSCIYLSSIIYNILFFRIHLHVNFRYFFSCKCDTCVSGYESSGIQKPVPGKALLPVLDVFARSTPTPPSGPPPEGHRPISKLVSMYSNIVHSYYNTFVPTHLSPTTINSLNLICLPLTAGRYKSPVGTSRNLPPLQGGQVPALGPRYEWVDVGMLDYNPDKKLYLVKRVFVPSKVLQQQDSRTGDGSGGESEGPSDSGSDSDGSDPNLNKKHLLAESSDNIHYWIPRVRLMFAAEDPTHFAQRVANAYCLREKTEAILRFIIHACTLYMHVMY